MGHEYSENDLRICLRELGVKKGDCLFVHSALKSLGKFGPDIGQNYLEVILGAMLNEVGENGTIVVPSFNFGFCHGAAFDIDNTPGERMGAFSEFVRTHRDSLRSKHPFHSVSAIGKNAKIISDARGFSEYSNESFFDKLLNLNCKILFLGIDFVETFVHISEERAVVPYRFWKTFSGKYISNGVERNTTVNFFARRFDTKFLPILDVKMINDYLREKGFISCKTLGFNRISICNSVDMVDELIRKINEEPLFLLGYTDDSFKEFWLSGGEI